MIKRNIWPHSTVFTEQKNAVPGLWPVLDQDSRSNSKAKPGPEGSEAEPDWLSLRLSAGQLLTVQLSVSLLVSLITVLSEAVDWCICFTWKIQHGGDWEQSWPQGPKNDHNFLLTVRHLSLACGHGTKILLILKKFFFTWLFLDIFWYDSPKKYPTILYTVNLWLKQNSQQTMQVIRIFRTASEKIFQV